MIKIHRNCCKLNNFLVCRQMFMDWKWLYLCCIFKFTQQDYNLDNFKSPCDFSAKPVMFLIHHFSSTASKSAPETAKDTAVSFTSTLSTALFFSFNTLWIPGCSLTHRSFLIVQRKMEGPWLMFVIQTFNAAQRMWRIESHSSRRQPHDLCALFFFPFLIPSHGNQCCPPQCSLSPL